MLHTLMMTGGGSCNGIENGWARIKHMEWANFGRIAMNFQCKKCCKVRRRRSRNVWDLFPSSHLFRRGLFKSQRLYQAQSAPQIVLWKLMPHFYGATMAAKSVKTTFVQKCFLILFFQYFERLRRRRWWKMAKFVQKVCAKTLSLISSLSWKVGNWGWGKWIG